MTNKELLKKQILYRSTHRGSKEMDILLGNFVRKYIDKLQKNDLLDLNKLLFIDDEIIYSWYFNNNLDSKVPVNNISKLLKCFKI